jgi:dihydroxyacetone kinase-like protein
MEDLNKSSRRLSSHQLCRISSDTLQRWMEIFAAKITESERLLTELDAAIGDGDHGVNMCRGMRAVLERLNNMAVDSPSGQLRIISTAMMSSVGGASGPLFGAFFLQCSHAAINKQDWGLNDLTSAMEAGFRGVVQLGKAAVGDKTMVDALAAMVASLRTSCGRHEGLPEALVNCRDATRRAAEATTPMIARKGRASYLGPRSAGTQDPGATSSSLLLDSLAQAIEPIFPAPKIKTRKAVLL